MKNFYLVWRHCLLMVLGCFICLGGFAQLTQLEPGKVYRFVNRMYPTYSMSVGSMTTAIGAATVNDSKSQLWYVAEVSNDGSGVPRYRLRSYGNGRYLQGAGQSTQWKLVESTTTDNTYLYLLTVGNAYNTMSVNNSSGGYNKMHCDGSKNIVGWSTDGQATQWTITEVSMTEEAIAANWEAINNFVFTDAKIADFKTALAAIFTDDACTTLKSAYAGKSLSELQADANYIALPVTLQNMVLKVWNEQSDGVATAWAEDHVEKDAAKAWSGDYAKRYRVQNYEIYTNRDCVNPALKINIHTNLNNPTGIITKERDALYIMVDGEIKEGASLYLGSYSGHGQAGNANDGVQLQTGLNVIPCFVDKQWTCIYYTANTMKAWDGETNKGDHPLSYYPDLKIHIEGGNVNGYYNEVGDALYAHGRTGENVTPTGDNELDWDYLAARNVLDDITIVGKRVVFQFNFRDPVVEGGTSYPGTEYYFTANAEGKRLVRVPDFLERWNRVVWAQNLTMGLESAESVASANSLFPTLDDRTRGVYAYTGNDSEEKGEYPSSYEDYYRMHCLAIGIPTGYMSGGWTSSNYNYGTFQSIIQGIITQVGAVWGPGHEIGHQHQGPINMNGLTEVTNNLFANICAWYGGLATSRTNKGEGDLTQVLKAYNQENSDFFTNNIWAQTQMYYKLWLYYHLAGHNNKFYPRLFEMLRRDPISRTYNQLDVQTVENGTVVTGKTPLLHFYKKCCEAAGEDLTEFFRAYGFFTPMDKRYVGDYASSEYTQTQAQIDATIKAVKKLGYPENHTVLFINDCTTGATFYQHDGVTQRAWWDNNTYSDLGAYTDYNGTTSNDEVTGTYELTVANGTATMSGATGGAGFLIYDEKGNLLSFSSDYSFPLSDAALLAIANGTATVKVLNAEGAATEVVYDGGSAAISLLSGLLDDVKIVVDAVDNGGASGTDYTKVGFYKQSEVTTLINLYNQAKALYDDNAQSGYVSAYSALKAEYDAVMANEFARVALLPGSTCVLVNKNDHTRYINETVTTTNDVTTKKVTTAIVSGGVVANVPELGQWIVEASSTTAGAYTFKNASTGDYWLALSQSTDLLAGSDKKDYTFIDNYNGTWGIKYAGNEQLIHIPGGNRIVGWGDTTNQNSHWYITMVSKDENVEATANLQTLVAQTTALMNKMANVSGKGAQDMSTFRITSNATEQGHGTALMVDGDKSTFFHTVWSGTAVNENHYFQIDCGEGLSLAEFVLSYTTRPDGTGGNDAPTHIIITGSNTTDAEGNVTDWTPITTLSEGLPTGKAASYTSDIIGSSSNTYRYLRFTVTTASGGTFGGYYYFGIAELGISRPEAQVNSIVAKYAAALGANQLTDAKLIAADNALYASKQLLANGEATKNDLTTLYTALKTQYDILLATYNAAESADLSAAQAALQEVIDKTQTLLNECGSVSIVKANVPLQSTDENASGYLYCNAPYTGSNAGDVSVQGSDGYHLLDGNKATYLHTNYAANAGPGEDHYLRVYVGESGIGQFRMLYTTRNSGDGQPTKMVIEGSNEATGTYTEIATLTKDDVSNPLPVTNGTDYTSVYFEGGTYKYLRFRILGNTSNNGKPDGHYWFCMAEFALERKASTTITNNNVGTVMDDDILTTYNAIESATTAKNLAKTVAQLNAAQAELQAQYDALFAAKTVVQGHESLKTAIDNATALKNSCYETDVQGNTVVKANYISNPNFSLEDLQNLEREISTAITVFRTAAATDDEVTAQETALAAAMTQLNRSFDYMALPITLTTNETAPVKYVIYVNRGDNIVSQYRGTVWPGDDANANNYKIHLAPNGLNNGDPYQAFYFTRGTSGTQLLMKAAADGRTFAVETGNLVTNDFNKVASYDMATTNATFAAKEWVMVANESHSGWFNIKAVPTNAEDATIYYFSNWGGIDGNQNFGFYHEVDDPGNLFRFEAWQEADKSALETAISNLNSIYDSCYDIDGENRTLKAAYRGNDNFDATVLDDVSTLITAAQAVVDGAGQYQHAVDAQVVLLNNKIAAIQAQINMANLPITLTTDTNNPVLYTIYFQRDATSYYLHYRGDESHGDSRDQYDYNKLKYNATLDRGNIYQAFYFTKSDVSGRLKMYAAADNKVFSVITGDLAAGPGKVKAFDAGEATQTFDAREWTISANANNDGWFNIAPVPNAATPLYLNNWNGITDDAYNIGFETDADNAGSLFKFASYQEADKTELNSALATLNTAYAACFSDPECTIIKSEYDGSLNLTQDNLDKVKAVIDAARAVSADELAYQSSVDEQTALVEAQTLVLRNLVAYATLPVKLTTDPAAPHYYRIYVNRSGRPLWQARTTSDPSSTKVQLTTAYDLGVDRQAWYFTAASEAPKLYIVNKNTTDRVLACTTGDFAEGAGKLQSLAVDYASVGANEWTITNEASQSGWYNITTVKTTTAQDGSTTNTTFYISNHGGVNNNMGFYNENSSSDGGSNFQFEEIDPTRSTAYNTLYNYFHDETKVEIDMTAEPPAFPADKIHDTAIGYYSSSLASDYLSAYGNAYYALKFADYYNDEQFTTFYNTLVQYNEALVTNAIDYDAYYVLRNAHTGYCNNAVAYANANDHKVYWHAQKNKVETTYIVDLNNGAANAADNYWKTWTSTETPRVTFAANAPNIETSSDNHLMLYSGPSETSDYTLTAPSGYVIDSYSFTFANHDHDTELTLTVKDDNTVYTTSRGTQTRTVANSGKSSVVMTLAGTNFKPVKLTDFTVKIRPSFTENEAVNVWKFEQVGNNAYLKNLHTGTYLTNAGTQYGARQLSTTGQPVTFNTLGDGQLNIKVNGSQMHAQNDGSAVVAYPGGKNTASAWYVEEVAVPEEITTRITMSQYQKASLYLAYPAIIPEGIKAYYAASEADATIEGTSGGSIYLTLFEGDVLPAGTPVILKGAQGAYKFDLSTTDEGTSPASNLFKGSAYKKLVQGETNYKYYLFGVKTVAREKKVGLYWAWLEYLADGTISNAGTDDGGYFYVPANKIYLPWNTASGAAPAFYFNFDGTTTGVDGIENVWDRNTGIYDLQGRRVNRIEQSGIYVINGQKRFVKVNGR